MATRPHRAARGAVPGGAQGVRRPRRSRTRQAARVWLPRYPRLRHALSALLEVAAGDCSPPHRRERLRHHLRKLPRGHNPSRAAVKTGGPMAQARMTMRFIEHAPELVLL